ncbi:hypothetical protein Ga0466249_005432, partial [Sporomusaceae bacterium BoRhaA]|nr:hypothetical protein [Pelorhabdus rhamnosifermentans]
MDDTGDRAARAQSAEHQLVNVRLPAGWTLTGLIAGLLLGWALAGSTVIDPILTVTKP